MGEFCRGIAFGMMLVLWMAYPDPSNIPVWLIVTLLAALFIGTIEAVRYFKSLAR